MLRRRRCCRPLLLLSFACLRSFSFLLAAAAVVAVCLAALPIVVAVAVAVIWPCYARRYVHCVSLCMHVESLCHSVSQSNDSNSSLGSRAGKSFDITLPTIFWAFSEISKSYIFLKFYNFKKQLTLSFLKYATKFLVLKNKIKIYEFSGFFNKNLKKFKRK